MDLFTSRARAAPLLATKVPDSRNSPWVDRCGSPHTGRMSYSGISIFFPARATFMRYGNSRPRLGRDCTLFHSWKRAECTAIWVPPGFLGTSSAVFWLRRIWARFSWAGATAMPGIANSFSSLAAFSSNEPREQNLVGIMATGLHLPARLALLVALAWAGTLYAQESPASNLPASFYGGSG